MGESSDVVDAVDLVDEVDHLPREGEGERANEKSSCLLYPIPREWERAVRLVHFSHLVHRVHPFPRKQQ